MGPSRRPPERWYIFTGTSPQDVGYRGDLLPDLLFRRPEIIDEANEWLGRLEIGYKIKVQSVGERSRDLFEVRLIDQRRGREVDVALSDVGFGISQILPFIVQSLAGERQIITIEQPEVHIHPRLQADLGDLLAATVREPRNHRFVIETHSEHLVLRMQRLIRDEQLTPNDVSIIYVSRGVNGSRAERLRLDENGDFIDDWPGGFFPERLRELM
jgi:predicted ATPase